MTSELVIITGQTIQLVGGGGGWETAKIIF